MINSNTSANESKNSIRWAQFRNFLRCLIWLFALSLCRFILQESVLAQYFQIGEPTSIEAYLHGLIWVWRYLTVLSLLWWFGAINNGTMAWGAKLRDTIERSSFLCSVIGSIIAFTGTAFAGQFVETGGIYATNHFYYPLGFIYILPAVFVCLMYALPPVSISKVILPANRFKIGTILILLLGAVLITILFTGSIGFNI